ncbi:MAG: hypothetical protein DI629_20655 [Mesorhizobium amorphae]|nr:MAG: hypothetical protein DI629_20655 [Mesorhizobium amorphae]
MTVKDLSEAEEARIRAWIGANPNEIHTSSHDDIISDEMAGMIMRGEFDEFDEAVSEAIFQTVGYPDFWESWEEEALRELGYDADHESRDAALGLLREEREYDAAPWIRDAVRGWKGNVTAILRGEDGEEFHVPGFEDRSRPWGLSERDEELFGRLVETFDPVIPADDPNDPEPDAVRLMRALEVVYGGDGCERLVACGKLDLLPFLESRSAPAAITIGPDDASNLLFYDHSNGCGNMGKFTPRKSVTLAAAFEPDESRRWGVDACYCFTGGWWRHELKASSAPDPAPAPEHDETPAP